MDDGGLSKGQLKKIKQKLAAVERCAYGHVVLYIHYILLQHRQGKLKQKECNHTVMVCIRALQKHKLFDVQHVQTVMTELKQDIQSDVGKEKNQSMSELLQKEFSLLQDEASTILNKDDGVIDEASEVDNEEKLSLLIKTTSLLRKCCRYFTESAFVEYDAEVLITAFPGILEKWSSITDRSLTSNSRLQQLRSTSTSTHLEEAVSCDEIADLVQNMAILPVSLDIGEYKVSPGSTYGEGVCWFTRFGKMLECSLEFFLDDERGNSYLGNLFTCHHHPNIIGCVYDTEQSGLQIFALERYHRTLRDFAADSTFLWGINKYNEATFSAFLSNTVLQLLSVIEFLVAKEIYVDDFGLGHVVYTASDLKLETPKLRHIFCFDQEKKPKDYCQYYLSCLRSMIEEMASNLKLSHVAGKFLECLTSSSMSLKRLQNHPVFWCKLMKLDYVIDIRNQLKDHTLHLEEDDTARFEACVGDWVTKVKANPDLSGREYSFEKKGPSQASMAVYFWRNTFEHLFDSNPSELEKRAKVEELMVSTHLTFVDYLYNEIGLDMNIKRDNSLKCDRPIIKLNINVPNEPDNM